MLKQFDIHVSKNAENGTFIAHSELAAFDKETDLKEFAQDLVNYSDQIYSKIPTNVNTIISSHQDLHTHRQKHLSASDTFAGEKFKAEFPHIYTTVIVASAIIESTRTENQFDRYSIQPSWMTGNLVIVREETHIDEKNKKVTFLGRPVDEALAQKVLIPALIAQIKQQDLKALNAIPENIKEEDLTKYLEANFKALFLKEKPALFHVCHGIYGEEATPFETWRLVRLESTKPENDLIYKALRERISSSISSHLYLKTIETLEGQKKTNKVSL